MLASFIVANCFLKVLLFLEPVLIYFLWFIVFSYVVSLLVEFTQICGRGDLLKTDEKEVFLLAPIDMSEVPF